MQNQQFIKLHSKSLSHSSQQDHHSNIHNIQSSTSNLFHSDQSLTSSQYLTQYIQYFWPNISIQPQSNIFEHSHNINSKQQLYQQLENQLINNRVFQKCSNFTQNIIIHSVQPTKYSQIVTIWLQLGFYKTEINILNLSTDKHQQSPLHHCTQVAGFGAFGDLYKIQNQQQQFAIKCIKNLYDSKGQNKILQKAKFLVSVLKEYFFVKLLSCLKIGPKTKNFYGFDILVTQECIQFSMEVCAKANFTFSQQNILKENLKKMHILKIVHRDIKPDNIMWSNEFNTPVFIDFGGTTFIEEPLGYRSNTNFIGTMGYVSSEMNNLLNSKKGLVDLYFNDIYGLRKLLIQINSTSLQTVILIDQSLDKINNTFFLSYMIKYKLFRKQIEAALIFIVRMKRLCIQTDEIDEMILQFMIQLKPNEQLRKLYWSLNGQIRAIQKFSRLKQTYTDQLSAIFSTWTGYGFKEQIFHQQISLYRMISIEYGNFSDLQKYIKTILVSKQSIQNYLRLQQFKKDKFLNNNEMVCYFIVCGTYCTLAHDRYKFEDSQKILLANKTMQKIQNELFIIDENSHDHNYTDLLHFNCRFQKFSQIGRFYEYFFLHIWKFVPQGLKYEMLKYIIASLSLLGYPFYVDQQKQYFMYFILREWQNIDINNQKNHFNYRLKGIVTFWLTIGVIKIYRQVYYDRQETIFLQQNKQIKQILNKIKLIKNNLMNDYSQQNLQKNEYRFLQLNKLRYKLYQQVQMNQEQQFYVEFCNFYLNQQNNFSTTNKRLLDQWKQSILLIKNVLPTKFIQKLQHIKQPSINYYQPHISNSQQSMNNTQHHINYSQPNINYVDGQVEVVEVDEKDFQQLKNSLKYIEFSDYSFHFTIFLQYCRSPGNMWRVKQILQIIDDEIIDKIFSQRCFIDLRIYVAWIDKDMQKLIKLIDIILIQTHNISWYNFQFVSDSLDIIHWIIVSQRNIFWSYSIWKVIGLFYLMKLVDKSKQYIHFFLNSQQFKRKKQQNTHNNSSSQNINILSHISNKLNSSQLDRANMFEIKMKNVYVHIKMSLRKMAHLIQMTSYFMKQGLTYYNIRKSFNTSMPIDQCPNPVQYLQSILPSKLANSIVLNVQEQQNLSNFILQTINSLDSGQYLFKDYNDTQWILNKNIMKNIKLPKLNQSQNIIKSIQSIYGPNFSISQMSQFSTHQFFKKQTLLIYYNNRIIESKGTNITDFQNLILSYKIIKKQLENIPSQNYKMLYETLAVQTLFDSYIYCQTDFQQFFQFLMHATRVLKNYHQQAALDLLKQTIKDKFFCICQMCFCSKPKNWKPLQFIEYIYSRIDSINQSQNPYFALIVYWALINPYLSYKIKLKLFIFVIKSMQYLCIYAKTLILYRLYEIRFRLKALQKKFYGINEPQTDFQFFRPQNIACLDDYKLHTQYYYAQKNIKNQAHTLDINKLIEIRFELKRKRKPKWKIPQWVQKQYRKKLYKFHFVLNGLDDNEFQPEIYKKYIDDLK